MKKKICATIATTCVCMAFWILLTWSLDIEELIAGLVVSNAIAIYSSRFFIHEHAFWFLRPARLFGLIAYIFIFLWELVKANWDVAKRCYGGCKNVNPGIVKVPAAPESEYGLAMLANSITLTPGTITMETTEENGKNYFYIHWIDVQETDGEKAGDMIKGTLEKGVRRVFK